MSEAKEKFLDACRDRRETLLREVTDRQDTIEKIEELLGEDLDGNGEKPSAPPKRFTTGKGSRAKKPSGKKGSSHLADVAAVVLGTKGPQKLGDLVELVERKGHTFKAKAKNQTPYIATKKDGRFVSRTRGIWELKK